MTTIKTSLIISLTNHKHNLNQIIMKLRSIYQGALPLLAVAMTACSSNEELARPVSESDAINFSIVSNNPTRSNSYGGSIKPTSFKVTAYDGNTNYFGNTDETSIDIISQTSDGGNTWTYEEGKERYWPEGKDENWQGLTFYACVDDDGHFTLPEDGSQVPKFNNFTVNSNVDSQKDLMYAVAKDVKKKNNNNGEVTLNFRHALSQISFTAQNKIPNVIVRILTVSVKNLYGKGTYTFPKNSTTSNTVSDVCGTWDFNGETNNSSYDLDRLTVIEGISESKSKIGGPTDALNVIPQNINGRYIEIQYIIENELNEKDTWSFANVEIDTEWKEGFRYNYNLIFSPTGISYGMTVASYNNGNEIEENISPKPTYKKALTLNLENGKTLSFADRNIGAANESDAGLYFWWGDINGHYYRDEKLYKADGTLETKTVNEIFNGGNKEIIANDTPHDATMVNLGWIKSVENPILTDERDAAFQLTDGIWSIPTIEDFEYLINSEWCQYTSKTMNGVDGLLITPVAGKGSGSIFLPKAGALNSTGFYSHSRYWSSTFDMSGPGSGAFDIVIYNNTTPIKDRDGAGNGYPIRAVCKE